MRRLTISHLTITVGLVIAVLISPATMLSAQGALDFELPNGHFYSQANGASGQGGTGYAIVAE